MGQETVSPSLKAWLSLRENVVRVAGTAPPLKMIPCSAPCLNLCNFTQGFVIILGSASIASSRGLKTLALTNGEPEIEDAGEVALGLMGWREDTWRMVCFERWYIYVYFTFKARYHEGEFRSDSQHHTPPFPSAHLSPFSSKVATWIKWDISGQILCVGMVWFASEGSC